MNTIVKERTNGNKAAETSIDLEITESTVNVPTEVEEKSAYFIDSYLGFLTERTEVYVSRMADLKARMADRKA